MAEETKNTKPADEEIEKTAEPTAGEEKQPETEKAEPPSFLYTAYLIHAFYGIVRRFSCR